MANNPQVQVPLCKEDITIPWLQSILQPHGHHSPVTSIHWKGEANNGHGLMSTIERLILETEEENVSLIFKTLPPKGSPLRDITISNGFAQRELGMYSELFPKWEEFLNQKGVPDQYRFRIPKCYYAAFAGSPSEKEDYHQIMVLEDLFASGFKEKKDPNAALNWEEAKPCIRWLALFHAVGMAYAHEKGIQDYSKEFPFILHKIDGYEDILDGFFESGFQAIYDLIKECSEEEDVDKPLLLEALGKLRQNGVERVKFLDPLLNGLKGTVTHCDLHVNNLMFHEEKKEDATEVVFYDFQASMFSAPMKDLSFFLQLNCDETLNGLSALENKVLPYYAQVVQEALSYMGMTSGSFSYTFPEIVKEYKAVSYLSILHILSGASYFNRMDQGGKCRLYKVFKVICKDGLLKDNFMA